MLDALVLDIGAANFSRTLTEQLRQAADVEQIIIYGMTDDGEIELLAAEGVDTVVRGFVGHYHQIDPTRRALAPVTSRTVEVAFSGVGERDDERLRIWWDLHHHGAERATILVGRPGGRLVIDLFHACSAGGRFDEIARGYISANAPLLSSAIERHFDLARPSAPSSLETWAKRLRNMHTQVELSMREALVCTYVLLGYSNEAVALHLGISPHSVVTYRRRSYAKLRITSQSELFALLLQSGNGGLLDLAAGGADQSHPSALDFADDGPAERDPAGPEAGIRQLLWNYCWALDHLDLPLGRKVWHEGGLAIYEGHFEGTGAEFWEWTGGFGPTRPSQLHRIGVPTMDILGAHAVTETPVSLARLCTRGQRYRLVAAPEQRYQLFTAQGRYVDLWARRHGQWGLEKRRYVRDHGDLQEVELDCRPDRSASSIAARLRAALARSAHSTPVAEFAPNG